jgi:CDP-2,3-bis-(O-geranylgeranyl)-sn-glycerol synthase
VSTSSLDPFACSVFLLAAFVLAGSAQALWLASEASRRWSWPLDGGRRFRGRRLLGDNKTARGFVVMVPATGLAFMVLALAGSGTPGLWPLTPAQYLGLGILAGAGCMLGELPNSFIKRQLRIPPGSPAPGAVARPLFFVVDRLDSTLGALAALMLSVPVPPATVASVLLVGVALHGVLSVVTFRLGGKARPA